jgi:hypothetical protein
VQVLEAFGPRLLGLHESEEINSGATRLTVEIAELLLYVAVTVALALALMVAVVALNVAVVAFAATVTDAGTVSAEFEFDRVIPAPPAAAARVRVTVQLLDEFGPRLDGVHDNVETNVGGATVIDAVAELPL